MVIFGLCISTNCLSNSLLEFKAQDVLVPWSRNVGKESNDHRSSDNNQVLLNFPKSNKKSALCTTKESNETVKNRRSSPLEGDRRRLTVVDFSSCEFMQIDPLSRKPNVCIIKEELAESKETNLLNLSYLKNSLSETVAGISEKLQLFSFAKRRTSSDCDEKAVGVSNFQETYSCNTKNSKKHWAQIREDKLWFYDNTHRMKCVEKSMENSSTHLNYKSTCYDGTSKIADWEACNNGDPGTSSKLPSFHRFYHVFKKDELLELLQCVPGMNVISQLYDHGNWAVTAEKQTI